MSRAEKLARKAQESKFKDCINEIGEVMKKHNITVFESLTVIMNVMDLIHVQMKSIINSHGNLDKKNVESQPEKARK